MKNNNQKTVDQFITKTWCLALLHENNMLTNEEYENLMFTLKINYSDLLQNLLDVKDIMYPQSLGGLA